MLGQRIPAPRLGVPPHRGAMTAVLRSCANPFEHEELVWLFLCGSWRNRWAGGRIREARYVRSGHCALSSFKDFQGCSGFSIIALLAQNGLFRRILSPEVGKLLLGDFYLLSAILETI